MKLDYDELMSEYEGEDFYHSKPKVKKFKDTDRDKIDHRAQKNIRERRLEKQKRQSQIEKQYEYENEEIEEKDELY